MAAGMGSKGELAHTFGGTARARSLEQVRAEFVQRLRERRSEAEGVLAQMRVAAPDDLLDGDVQHEAGLRQLIASCIDCGLESIEAGGSAPRPLPPAVIAQVRRAASGGMTLDTALRRCTAAHTLIWSVVLEEFARQEAGDHGRVLLLEASAAMGSVLAQVQVEIAAAHSQEIARRASSSEQRRFEIVRKLLVAEAVDQTELAELGYELNRWHLALVARGREVRKALRRLEDRLGLELLLVKCGEESVWAWLGGRGRLDGRAVEQIVAAAGLEEVSLAVGEPQHGLEGWRLTHREATGAALVARFRPGPVTRYADVAPEVTALQNPALADSLVERYLRPLDELPIGGADARRALQALFDSKHNVSSTAHMLGVHRSTVHRWRNCIEDRLGPLHQHQGDIEIALRVEQLRANL